MFSEMPNGLQVSKEKIAAALPEGTDEAGITLELQKGTLRWSLLILCRSQWGSGFRVLGRRLQGFHDCLFLVGTLASSVLTQVQQNCLAMRGMSSHGGCLVFFCRGSRLTLGAG